MIVRVGDARTTTRVLVELPRWRCEICEREWQWAVEPTECGFCAHADDLEAARELAEATAIEAVSPAVISPDERRALREEPYRMVAGLASYRRRQSA